MDDNEGKWLVNEIMFSFALGSFPLLSEISTQVTNSPNGFEAIYF